MSNNPDIIAIEEPILITTMSNDNGLREGEEVLADDNS